jgi:hypothetical protein
MKKLILFALAVFVSTAFYGQTDWKKTTIGKSLSLSTPFEMKSASLDLSEETKKKIDSYITFSGQDDDESIFVMAVTALYNPSIKTNLQAALDASVNGLRGSDKSQLHFEQGTLKDFGIEGLSAIGYVEDESGEKSYFKSYFYGKDNKYWNIIIMYLKDDAVTRNKVSQVHQSIKINAN